MEIKTPIFSKDIDKTVVVKFQDALDMMRFCNESMDDVAPISKKFLDWYLINGTFTIPVGMLVLEEIQGHKDRVLALSFDFSDVDYPEFCLYNYKTQEKITSVRFPRQENLDMVNLNFILRQYDPHKFDRIEDCFFGARADLVKMRHELSMLSRHVFKLNQKSNKKAQSMFKNRAWKIHHTFHYSMFGMFIQMTYAAQFYFTFNPPKEIISDGTTPVFQNNGKKIKTIYKYTGYVNLADKRIYKQEEDRDPDAPVREYQRHIQRWSVRGHYRKVNGGLIWIDPHIKGKGDIVEPRIYGTLDEDEIDVIPQIFEVERSVPIENEIAVMPDKSVLQVAKVMDDLKAEITQSLGIPEKYLGEVVTTTEEVKVESTTRLPPSPKRKTLVNKIVYFFRSLFKSWNLN